MDLVCLFNFRQQTLGREFVHRHRQQEITALQSSRTGGNIGVILSAETVTLYLKLEIFQFQGTDTKGSCAVLLYKVRCCIHANTTAQIQLSVRVALE